ncbi:MAG: hypothetical protein C0501_30525, partial [Isosphaera sp.]|nr:hypothetical protein [Isosphaera sp.]
MTPTPKTMDEAVERLDRLVDLARVSNTIAAATYGLLQRAAAPAPPQPVARPDLPDPPRPADVSSAVLGQAASRAPAAPAPVPSVPAPGPAAPGGAPAPPQPGPPAGPKTRAGKLWDRVKRTRVGRALSGVADRTKRWAAAGRATGIKGAGAAAGVAGGLAGGVGLLATAFGQLRAATDRLT